MAVFSFFSENPSEGGASAQFEVNLLFWGWSSLFGEQGHSSSNMWKWFHQEAAYAERRRGWGVGPGPLPLPLGFSGISVLYPVGQWDPLFPPKSLETRTNLSGSAHRLGYLACNQFCFLVMKTMFERPWCLKSLFCCQMCGGCVPRSRTARKYDGVGAPPAPLGCSAWFQLHTLDPFT